MKNKLVYVFMRVSLGAVFLIFGIGKFRNDIWAETIKTLGFFTKLPWDVNISITLIGAIELLTGAALITGFFTRFFSAIAAAQLIGILALLKFAEIRDIGLLGAAIYMAVKNDEAFGVGGFWNRSKGGKR